ncbi:MAG: biopolymer transporter ExbD [Lentimicrobium sp.]|nr:biopolymer transporter ExbD [Lentimicrobium sp.]
MAIKTRNKINSQFSTASMSDLVFLLLIFFMLTSTLVSPNAIKLLLPSSSSKTMAKQSLTVYIDANYNYYIEENRVNAEFLVETIGAGLQGEAEASVVLRADQSVPLQYIVTLIDAVNQINDLTNTKHKVILATKPI